jgi:hypothetical protein
MRTDKYEGMDIEDTISQTTDELGLLTTCDKVQENKTTQTTDVCSIFEFGKDRSYVLVDPKDSLKTLRISRRDWSHTWWKEAIPLIRNRNGWIKEWVEQWIEIGKTLTYEQLMAKNNSRLIAQYLLNNMKPFVQIPEWSTPPIEVLSRAITEIRSRIKQKRKKKTENTHRKSNVHMIESNLSKRNREKFEVFIRGDNEQTKRERKDHGIFIHSSPRIEICSTLHSMKKNSDRYNEFMDYLIYIPEIDPSYIAGKLDEQAISWKQVVEFAFSNETWTSFCEDLQIEELSVVGRIHLRKIAHLYGILSQHEEQDDQDTKELYTSILSVVSKHPISTNQMIVASKDPLQWSWVKDLLKKEGVKMGHIHVLQDLLSRITLNDPPTTVYQWKSSQKQQTGDIKDKKPYVYILPKIQNSSSVPQV